MADGKRSTTTARRQRPSSTSTGDEAVPERLGEIIRIAARKFRDDGYAGTSVQSIAEEVGVLKGSLYHYIRSKDDLLYLVIRGVHTQQPEMIKRNRNLPGTSLHRLRAFINIRIQYSAEHVDEAAVWHQDGQRLEGERRREILRYRAMHQNYIDELIEQCQREGSIAPNVEPKALRRAISGLMVSLYQWYSPSGEWPPRKIADLYTDLLMNGLVGIGTQSETAALPA